MAVTASDGWQSVKFATPVALEAGSQYLITVGGDGTALDDTLRIGSSGSVQSSYGYIVYNGWVDSDGTTAMMEQQSTPMVRMNMNPMFLDQLALKIIYTLHLMFIQILIMEY